MNQTRLNAYRIMWLFVFFDLPTNTKKERKAASKFRNDLLRDGFTMMQYSVYIRHCASKENAEVHSQRVRTMIPEKGQISILMITDKQYGSIINFWGNKSPPQTRIGAQLELF
ncbi:MAG: CRISPR-associated endonuclease Cas2 [Calditrichaceae bacterium]|nr:CRISPR-associated endonuclease Cas2 [Calditrichaceae bacterium]MBN2709756.1 CRISPR-associated endonuclease Cas2 [Calditrichaceae bacterium]RQV94950.1 MAG: CRISPR-associated endonuclease Cas2 [Calditrichota bacterium]